MSTNVTNISQRIDLNGIAFEIPANWQDQVMITLTLPSPDKNVRPNVILTKERLQQQIDLKTYFSKIKEAIAKRGIKDFKISDERQIEVDGTPAMFMVCSWDVAQMRAMMAEQAPDSPQPAVTSGQVVKQVQVSLINNGTAVNMTASFPADQFDTYFRPFKKFLETVKVK